jgi:YVTN family beta-propeller protein
VKLVAATLLIGCIVSVACGQWVEKIVYIPDSVSVLRNPGTMLYNPGNNFLFVGGDNGVAVFDGLTDRLITRATRGGLGPRAACYASQVNKLYWVGGGNTFALDGATGRDRATILTPNGYAICYNPVVNRVYASAHDTSGLLLVIDAANDSVTRRLRIGIGYEPALVCNPLDNKVYVMSSDDGRIFVVDCATDSVIDTLQVNGIPGHLVYNRISDKLYCCDWSDEVTVIDCRSDTVLARISLTGGIDAAAFNPVANKLYCDDGAGIDIICGQGDTLLGRVPLSRDASILLVDSTDNLVWCSSYSDTIYAVDGQGDSLCAAVAVGNAPNTMCYNPTRNRVYLDNPHLTVVDPVAERVEKRVLLGFTPAAVCWAKSSNKLYCAGLSEAAVAVVGSGNMVQGYVPVGRDPSALAYDRPLGLICCANVLDSSVSIIACGSDSVIATVKVGIPPKRLCVDTVLHKAWCSSDSAVAVIDLRAESLTAVVPVPAYEITALLVDPARARVYCATAYKAHVVAFDAAGDTMIAQIPVGGYAQDLSLNPGANVVYCLTSNNEAVAVIDAAELRVVKIVPVGGYPQVLLYTERRNKLYCSNWSDNSLTVIDGYTQEPVATVRLTTWTWAMAYDPDADRLHCLDNSNNYVAIVDCRRDSLVKVVSVGSQPVAAAYAPAFRRMYVANQYGSSLSVIRDTVHSGIEAPDGLPAVARPAPTVIRGVLLLPEAVGGERLAISAHLLDISGRKVLDLHPGANDVRALAPGVYFIKDQSVVSRQQTGTGSVNKVVITR